MATKKIKAYKKNNDWTMEEKELLYALREEGINYKTIALELRRSLNACEKKYRTTNWREEPFFDPIKNRMKESVKRAYREKILNSQERRLSNERYKVDILSDRIADACLALPQVPKKIYIPSKKVKKSTEDVGLIFSDAHIGHHHTLEETGGISAYDTEIFKKRMEQLKVATSEIVELHSHLYNLPKLNIFCLGDMVAGMNQAGSWSATYINTPILDQVFLGFDAIVDAIYYWLGLFDEIEFFGVGGNHGRCGPKGVEKEYVNWDVILYKFLQSRFADNPRVKFNVPLSWWILTEIRNHKFLLMHGDGIKGNGVTLNNLINAEASMIGLLKDIPDYTLAAHFHSPAEVTTNHSRIIVNGSFIGSDIYSLKELRKGGIAEQKIFGIHDKRGITWSYNLNLNIS
ncbi:MAG: hypothetical protein WDA06_00130 [Phenylobacterium sp.]